MRKPHPRRLVPIGLALLLALPGAAAVTVPGLESPADPGPAAPAPAPTSAGTVELLAKPARVKLGRNASLGGRRLLPSGNPWNTKVDTAPVDPDSDALIAAITGSLHADFGADLDGAPFGIPYIVVKGSQKKVKVTFDYAEESDPGPYPIPRNAPIEGGADADGDRHVLVLDRTHWKLYELWDAHPVNGGTSWRAGSGAVFNLKSNKLRPAGWTSADAAGLPVLPGLVRYDEVKSGRITHALRFTVARTRRAYLAPATHWASSSTDPGLPPMGMRVRLKAGFDISGYPKAARVILKAMKAYGLLLADNGQNWFVSGTPDPRWDDGVLDTIKRVPAEAFEVVEMNGVVEG